MSDRAREIERAIAEGRMNAAQVFTQMLQLAQAARAQTPNLSRIAQKKLDQMGATVHGVLVKNEAGAWAAVSDAGRVMWLDDFEGKSARAQQAGSEEPVAWLCLWPNGKPWGAVIDLHSVDIWMRQSDEGRTVRPLYTHPSASVPDESRPLPANRYGVDRDYFTKKLEILIRDMRDYTPSELARSLGRLAMTANSETMREPEFNIGDLSNAPKYLDGATTPQPADNWIQCSERQSDAINHALDVLSKHGDAFTSVGAMKVLEEMVNPPAEGAE